MVSPEEGSHLNLLWILVFYSISVDGNEFYLMFCLEDQSIKSGSLGLQKLTVQNLCRKLEEVIEKESLGESSLQIYTEDNFYLKSKAYQKFLKRYLNSWFETSEIEYSKVVKDFHNRFFDVSVQNQTFLEGLQTLIQQRKGGWNSGQTRAFLQPYVQEWNQRILSTFPKKLVSSQMAIPEQKKLLQKVAKVQTKYTEIVNATPFDLTYEERGDLQELKS